MLLIRADPAEEDHSFDKSNLMNSNNILFLKKQGKYEEMKKACESLEAEQHPSIVFLKNIEPLVVLIMDLYSSEQEYDNREVVSAYIDL